MKDNWTIKAVVSAVITFAITYLLTHSTITAAISAVVIFIILLIYNPQTRYLMAFYTVISPLVSTIAFTIKAKTENFDIWAGIKELNPTTTIALFIIAVICLLLDYFERNEIFTKKKDEKTFIELIKKPYQEQIDQLKATLKDKEKIEGLLSEKIAKLEKERDRRVTEAKELFEKFEAKDISKSSKLYKKALRYFMQGKLYEALDVLDLAKMQKAEQAAIKKIKKTAETRMLKAQLLRVAGKFKEAGDNYEKALALIFDWDNCFKVGHYFEFLNEFTKAEKYYQLCLINTNNKIEKAFVLNNLANVHSNRNEVEKAEQEYNEVLQIGREQATVNPKTFLPNVAMTLNNLAILHWQKQEIEKAEQEYQEALQIYRELVATNSQTYLLKLAQTLNNLANLHRDKNEFEKAEQEYSESLQIYRELGTTNSQIYLPDIADTLNNLAVLHRDKNEFEKAKQECQESLQIYKELAETNSQSYLPNIAIVLNTSANLYHANKEVEKAEQDYQEALQIYRELGTTNPQVYLPGIAGTLNNLANLHCGENEFEKAEQEYQEALQIRRELATANPQTYLLYVAQTLFSMSIFYQKSKVNKKRSIQLADEAITILLLFSNIPYIQNYLKRALMVLKDWGINTEEYLKSKENKEAKQDSTEKAEKPVEVDQNNSEEHKNTSEE